MTEKLKSFIFFCFVFGLYYYFSFDKVSFGDCIGYAKLVETGNFIKTATSADHFLYTNTMIFFHKISGLDTIESIRVFSVLSAVIALFIFFKALNLTFNKTYSYLGTLIFMVSFTFWRTTETIEACTFNSIFLSLFLYYSLRFFKQKRIKDLQILGFVLGFSFWSHVQNIMLIPAFLYLLFSSFPKNKKGSFFAFILFLIPAVGLFIPAIVYQYDLINVYSSANPSWVKGTFTKSFSGYLKDFAVSLGYLVYNFWYFLLFAGISIWYRIRKINVFLIYFILAFGIPFAFGTFYNVSDNYVYFIGPYQILILYILDGIRIASEKYRSIVKISFGLTVLVPFLYLGSGLVISATEQGQRFNELKQYKGGLSYYLYPWMINNVGILETTIENRPTAEAIPWMTECAKEYIELRKNKQTTDELKKD